MKIKKKYIHEIPVLCWGEPSQKVILAFHGSQSHKEDTVIEILAEAATKKGYQVWSFDLPEHGERKNQAYHLNPQNVVAEADKILSELEKQTESISVFGCSIGAYFSMLACQNRTIEQSFFLSPIVDMRELIENMLRWSNLTPADLQQRKRIETQFNTLEWDYYQYVIEHPINWMVPTKILYGEKDNLTSRETIEAFCAPASMDLTILEEGEHFFHTAEELLFYKQWLKKNIPEIS